MKEEPEEIITKSRDGKSFWSAYVQPLDAHIHGVRSLLHRRQRTTKPRPGMR